jgi:fumarate hydratase, class I
MLVLGLDVTDHRLDCGPSFHLAFDDGGFYLGSIGGPAARLAQDCIKKVEVHEYPELGMEAVWRIEVENFPAFIVIDDKGNDFFKEVNLG